MTNPYRNINELREWLKANSSGACRPSDHAATVIEEQESELITLRAENADLRAKLAAMEDQKCVAAKELGRWAGLESLHEMPNGSRLYAKPVPADKPASRITEQDAREIAQSALMFWRNTVNLTLDVWMKDHAPTLLNKLNADREAERFCDSHCTWRDHHPDCPSHESEQSDSPALYDCCCGDTAESWRLCPAHSEPDSEGEK